MSSNLITRLRNLAERYHVNAFYDIAIFAAILILFHLLWRFTIGWLVTVPLFMNSMEGMSRFVFVQCKWIMTDVMNLQIVSFDQLTVGNATYENVFYYSPTNAYNAVNTSCSGLKQFLQFAILMLIYPGPWRHKAWYIPLGIVILHLVNLVRIVGMTFVMMNKPENWDFWHDDIFRPLFYVVMFALWVFWNERFFLKRLKEKRKLKEVPGTTNTH
jgi:exosortase/archaeosortase family protein